MRQYGVSCDTIEDCLRIVLDEDDSTTEDPRKVREVMRLMLYTIYENSESLEGGYVLSQ